MKYTYSLVLIATVIIPVIFSFHRRLQFHKRWKHFLWSSLITAAVFITWDTAFTSAGVWGFSEEYVSGLYFLNLPIEEVLFFFCIPYSCVFTWHCLSQTTLSSLRYNEEKVTATLIFACIGIAIFNFNKLYTCAAFGSAAMLLTLTLIAKVSWLKRFYPVYLILLLPFFLVNGVLTGTGLEKPVVWYNDSEILRLRIFTIPVEDVFYGLSLILSNVSLYQYFLKKEVSVEPAAGFSV